jgi:hypothetical protein
MQICDDTCIWHPLLASSPSTRSTRGEVDCQDGTYPPLQTIGMELLEVGRARFFVLHIAALKSPHRPLGVELFSKTKKGYWFRVLAKYFSFLCSSCRSRLYFPKYKSNSGPLCEDASNEPLRVPI